MQPKCSKKNVCNSAKTSSSQDLVHQHMSNHYRRILNAKKTVDTSPPYCYKPRRPNTVKRQTSAPSSRNKTKGRKIESSRNTSPALTERSISTNSYKESFWGTESVVGSSRYHAACIQSYTGSVPPPKNTYFNMDLINRITYDTKHGPAAYCDEKWVGVKPCRPRQTEKTYKNPTTVCIKSNKSGINPKRSLQSREHDLIQKRKFSPRSKLMSSDVMEKQSHLFASFHSKFFPRILKTDAVSKLRSLRVYYPPRRKERRERRTKDETPAEMPIKCTLDSSKCKCTKICVCDENEETLNLKKNPDNPKEQSQTSSRDSAYNGGVSSLPESRSPTPDQRRKKECGCIVEDESFFCEKKLSEMKVREEPNDVKSLKDCHCTRNESPRGDNSDSDLTTQSKPRDEDSLRKLKDDALYIKFVQDITVEILEKSLYTNKALKRVMKRHLIENLQTLDKDRMIKELENLRIQLGIPEDDKFFDTESNSIENVESFTEFLKPFPVISDSAFVIPKQDEETSGAEKTEKEDTLAEVPKNETHKNHNNLKSEKSKQVLLEECYAESFESDSEDDEELISVIQMTKTVRDKRKEKSVRIAKTKGSSNEENSSEESDESIKCKNKSKFQKVKCRNCSCHASSESEGSKDKRKKIMVKTKNTKNKDDDDGYDCDSSSSVHLFSEEKIRTKQTTISSKQYSS